MRRAARGETKGETGRRRQRQTGRGERERGRERLGGELCGPEDAFTRSGWRLAGGLQSSRAQMQLRTAETRRVFAWAPAPAPVAAGREAGARVESDSKEPRSRTRPLRTCGKGHGEARRGDGSREERQSQRSREQKRLATREGEQHEWSVQ